MQNIGNYITELYALKYYHECKDESGLYTRLEILQKGYSGVSMAIGELRSLSLQIQGSQDDIVSPLVKTNLTFSMVDSYDKVDAATKHGNWQEFYTPDSTMYLVKLYTKVLSTDNWSLRWSGYVTPDAWQESLDYYGDISITARDNIGHLQDFEFDLEGDTEGLISVYDIIKGAMSKISLPMNLIINDANDGDAKGIESSGVLLGNALINVAKFNDGSWEDALTQTLESLGMVLRYVDDNSIALSNIRNITLFGKNSRASVSEKPLTFLSGSTKMVDPAYKKIVEALSYDHNDESEKDIYKGLDFTGSTVRYDYSASGNILPSGSKIGAVGNEIGYYIANSSQRGWRSDKAAFFDKSKYKVSEFWGKIYEGESVKDYVFLLANTNDYMNQSFDMFTCNPNVTISMEMAEKPCGLVEVLNSGHSTGIYEIAVLPMSLYKVTYKVAYKVGSSTRYWNGYQWSISEKELSSTYDAQNSYEKNFSVKLDTCSDLGEMGVLTLTILRIEYKVWPYGQIGIYARVSKISLSSNAAFVTDDTVTTINNEDYNVKLDRKPDIGVLSSNTAVVDASTYENILYHRPTSDTLYPYGYKVNWTGSNTEYPLPVMVHLQLLCYHITAMEILEGDCVVSNKGHFAFGCTYSYKGGRYILESGTLDLLSGRISSAVMRQFIEYSDVWDDKAVEYERKDSNGVITKVDSSKIILSLDAQSVGKASGAFNIKVTTSGTWTVISNNAWAQVSMDGQESFDVDYDENPATSARTATITITNNYGASKQFILYQSGITLTLSVSPTSTTIDYTAQETEFFNVTTNDASWTVVSDSSWAVVVDKTDTTFALECDLNNTEADREATITIVTASGLTTTVKILQTYLQ